MHLHGMKTKNIQTKQRRGFQKTETKIILPTELTQAIEDLKLPAAMTEKAIDIAGRIIYKKGVGTYVNVEYVPLSVNHPFTLATGLIDILFQNSSPFFL